MQRAFLATAWVYGALVGGIVWIARHPLDLETLGRNPVPVLLLGIAFVGLLVLGRGAWSESWGRRPLAVWLVVAPFVGVTVLVLSALWVRHWYGPSVSVAAPPTAIWVVLLTALIIAYSEELLFRGVLWTAIVRRSSGPLRPIVQSAALFAIAHLCGGGQFGELPHRALAGLALGVLRWKSESLWPCIHAHFLVNAIAPLV